jgi:flagellar biosynthesis protein FlhF
MRYIKIKAKGYNDAMMKLKMDYGDDAIPISHKWVKEGGVLNSKLFAKDMVELTAAIQEKKTPFREKVEAKSRVDFTVDDVSAKKTVPIKTVPSVSAEIPRPNLNRIPVQNQQPAAETSSVIKSAPTENREVVRETASAEVKDEPSDLKKIEREFREIKETLNRLVEAQGREREKPRASAAEDNTALDPYRIILRNNDYDTEESDVILDEIKNTVSREDLKDRYKIEKTLKDLLKSRIVTSGPIKMGHKKKIVMFFGPTGVGKTTTMAKLGALHHLRESHTVAFITIDNYRIAATEQLKKYAEIMKIPIHVVSDQKTFKEVIDRERAEIIMVDTSGRSHRNDLKISEIKSFADMIEYDFEKMLCISANTKKVDAVEIFKAFDKIHFDSVVITKVDETTYVGNIVNVADKYKKPISYYTNGQEVPNDIVIADPEKLVNMMMGIQNN